MIEKIISNCYINFSKFVSVHLLICVLMRIFFYLFSCLPRLLTHIRTFDANLRIAHPNSGKLELVVIEYAKITRPGVFTKKLGVFIKKPGVFTKIPGVFTANLNL